MDEEREVRIRVRPDGSLKIYGPIRVFDVDDREYDLEPFKGADKVGDRVKLCRCGHSKTQPFCDESHKGAGFSSQPRVGDL